MNINKDTIRFVLVYMLVFVHFKKYKSISAGFIPGTKSRISNSGPKRIPSRILKKGKLCEVHRFTKIK